MKTSYKGQKWGDVPLSERIKRTVRLVAVLAGLTPHQQRKHFDMSAWAYKTGCGTIGCAAGHCGLNPWFRNQGFKIDLVRDSFYPADSVSAWDSEFTGMTTGDFFGSEIDNEIFTNRRFTRADSGQKVYRAVLKAAKLYLLKLEAEQLVERAEAALDKLQTKYNDATYFDGRD